MVFTAHKTQKSPNVVRGRRKILNITVYEVKMEVSWGN